LLALGGTVSGKPELLTQSGAELVAGSRWTTWVAAALVPLALVARNEYASLPWAAPAV
jgi:hypothetical protein